MSSPFGSVTGNALDVVVVVPSPSPRSHGETSPKGDCAGVIASSEFYVNFPSSVRTGVTSSSSVAKLQRWTSSFLYNNSSEVSDPSAIADEPTKQAGHSTDCSLEDEGVTETSSSTLTQKCSKGGNTQVQINGRPIPNLEMNFRTNQNGDSVCKFIDGNGYRPSTQALEILVDEAILNYGRNLIRYILYNEQNEPIAAAEAFLYLWSALDSVIVCDIDGTITKSDVRGVLDTVVQDNFKHVHNGVCKFLNELVDSFELGKKREGSISGRVRLFYLSSRPISYISQTRKLLVGLSQQYGGIRFGLPPGPIMCHRGSLSTVLHSELVAKNVYEFKADVLARQIVLPFVAAIGNCQHKLEASEHFDNNKSDSIWRSDSDLSELTLNAADDRLFLAGFGNKATDAKAYELSGLDRRDIYIINKESRIQCLESESIRRGSTEHSLSISTNSELPDFCCVFDATSSNVRRGSTELNVSEMQRKEITSTQVEVAISPVALESPAMKAVSKSKGKIKSTRQTIRAFSLKKSFASFRSQDSLEGTFYGYDDPNLLVSVSERMKRSF